MSLRGRPYPPPAVILSRGANGQAVCSLGALVGRHFAPNDMALTGKRDSETMTGTLSYGRVGCGDAFGVQRSGAGDSRRIRKGRSDHAARDGLLYALIGIEVWDVPDPPLGRDYRVFVSLPPSACRSRR